jgi:Holliday junction resolvasome RuvABC endonuclease subunit
MNPARRCLALDLGTHTGWAISEGNRIVPSGVREFSLNSKEHKGQRGIKFYNFLLHLGRFDAIFYEKIQFTMNRRSGDGGELYKGFLMLVNMVAAGFNIPTYGIHPGTLKKDFTGNGRAEKWQICDKAREYGWTAGAPGTALYDDEADAIALLITQSLQLYNDVLSF